MTVSVIIPCLNEEKYVGKLLEGLIAQTSKANGVYVVDCHSTDKTVAVAQEFMKRLPLTVL
jgi:glycosyltransferase involved in cell wall biosynthesis